MTETTAKRNWLRLFSPCVIASILTVIAIIMSLTEIEKSGGWSMIGVIVALPFLIILLIIDALIKTFTKDKTVFIWLVEIGLITIIILIFLRWTR